ncbi:hypothetical protein RN001_013885 [Aquatica leii]|uniref:Cation-dependent mannose-6-phosphate receptor n=1 Tax=Aquatica leii TaxID=1421715 RepID=A0AAN7NWT9_9COLE|nr:hypothetical protein RN001_013885 [Aquatica leii]
MIKNTILSIFLCILFSNRIHSIEEFVCIETSVCLCNSYDNKYIDISPLGKTNLTVENQNLRFFFYPCRNVSLDYKDIGVNSTATSDCASGATLCVYNTTDQKLTNLGIVTEGKFSNFYPKTLSFLHGNKSTTVLLECTPDFDISYLVNSVSDGNHYNFTLFSPHSCTKTAHPGLSVGSTLLILCTTIFGVYLIGGALVLHFLRGARGRETIPNIEFWSSLPGLVKDGTIFVLTGCNPMVISSADTYDKI